MASRRDLLLQSNIAAEQDVNDDDFSESSEEEELTLENDYFLTAIDDLEGRIVSALDAFKIHTGVKRLNNSTNVASFGASSTIHDELKETLRPVLEIAAHSGPALARRYASYRSSVDRAVEEVYSRLNSDLILPVLLECAQTDMIPAKRAAALGFFHDLYREYISSGSYLADEIALYGASSSTASSSSTSQTPTAASTAAANALVAKQRAAQRSARTAELLRYWIEASAACTVAGAFTDIRSDGAIASRAVVSAGAVVRPALKHIAEKISSADDAGAMKIYLPLMKMMGGVLRRLLSLDSSQHDKKEDRNSLDALRSSCIKFLEIVVLTFSTRLQPGAIRTKQRNPTTAGDDFAIDDLPIGHPIITRQALEEIGEDSFTVLKGLLLAGGQVKTDSAVIRDVMLGLGMDTSGLSPSAHIVAIVRPAALSFIELQSSMRQTISEDNPFPLLDRNNLEYNFLLSQKSYSLVINAVSILAINRPIFYKDSATCLTWRTMDPPSMSEPAAINGVMTKPGVTTIQSHLKASCLTLLRNTLSVSSGESISNLLFLALSSDAIGMKVQAEKALRMAQQNAALKTAGRAARNRANMFYEWDQSRTTTTSEDIGLLSTELEDLDKKRQRAGDDAIERLRMARVARGLGNGIQLPASMADCVELIMVNLTHLPTNRANLVAGEKRPTSQDQDSKKTKAFSLDSLIDMITTNGASLTRNDSRWYARDGGDFWNMDSTAMVSDDETDDGDESSMRSAISIKDVHRPARYSIDRKKYKIVSSTLIEGRDMEDGKVFKDECKSAASDAFHRIVCTSHASKDSSVTDLGNRIAARLAWTLKGVQPANELQRTKEVAVSGITSALMKESKPGGQHQSIPSHEKNSMVRIAEEFPLVPACLTHEILISSRQSNKSRALAPHGQSQSLTNRTMAEAYCLSSYDQSSDDFHPIVDPFDQILEIFLCSLVRICELADEKLNDVDLKKSAYLASTLLPHQIAIAPALTHRALKLISSLCDIEGVSKRAIEAASKSSNRSLASSAAAHAAKVAAEKRATIALLILRDIAFQRSESSIRSDAINCAVAIASGRLPSIASIEDKALKLVMNVLFPRNDEMENEVVQAAKRELDSAASYAEERLPIVEEANRKVGSVQRNPLLPFSDEEKAALDRIKKPVVLYMALCVRRPEMIKYLLELSSRENSYLLSKAVRGNMPKLTKAAAAKYDIAKIALSVADQVNKSETPMLLSFLDNLCPPDGVMPTPEMIETCLVIQDKYSGSDGKKDARFLIPVVSGMKRHDLQKKLCDFVAADDNVLKAALHRMSERVTRYALVFRDDADNLHGMSLCEQLVFLHNLDFATANLPQKRYVDAIRLCLDDVEVFTDRVIMAAFDYISSAFLLGEGLPLAFMRSMILTCSKHESLHSWICHFLLPKLIEGKIYNDRRHWEGWMRCANMLENTANTGVSSIDIIRRLPQEQYEQYRSKYS